MVSLAPALLPVAALTLGITAMSPPTFDQVSPPSALAAAGPAPASPPTPAPPTTSPAAAGGAARSVDVPRQRWRWPLAPEPAVARRFERPASPWGPGHRGVDLSATSGQPVLAVAAGRVVHVGVIAGRGTISVLHAGGVRTTYEPVAPQVRRGQVVRPGQVIGLVDGSAASHCGACLHLGALRGRVYLDPLALLRPGHVVLLPLGTG